MTRVVCLLGSPREGGNSDQLAGRFCAAAKMHGAQTRTHSLRDLRFQGYVDLNGAAGQFGSDDDLAPVLSDVEDADVLVLATPIYFCNVTGLMKQALDRFFAFFVSDYLTADVPSRLGTNRTLVLAQTQGEVADKYETLLEDYSPAFDKLGFTNRYLLRAAEVREPSDIFTRTDVLEEADLLARRIVLGNDG